MASSSFGIDAESVRRHHFPNADAFSASSRPSAATVAEVIEEEAASMAGALALELVVASDITPASSAYNACRKTLRMQVAAKLVRLMSGVDSALAQAWDAEVARWYEQLDEGGASFLGDGATATGNSDADGPTSHVSVYGLTTATADELSSPVPFLKMDDEL